jgi:dTDP-4-dehydrorhamnose 3,5-epimerase
MEECMIFTPSTVTGALHIALEKREDPRGFLGRSFSMEEFGTHGMQMEIREGYTAASKYRGTMRGFHYMIPPRNTAQLTRVTRGSIYEVILDMRPDSPTYKKWQGFTMTHDAFAMLYIPPVCAHAYLTLEDDTEFINLYSEYYDAAFERGIRYDDPAFSVSWPIAPLHISDKDKTWQLFKEAGI